MLKDGMSMEKYCSLNMDYKLIVFVFLEYNINYKLL